jgi:hypothetical protein
MRLLRYLSDKWRRMSAPRPLILRFMLGPGRVEVRGQAAAGLNFRRLFRERVRDGRLLFSD